MKAKIACVVIGLLMSVGLQANHILGGNISYECLGGDQYLFTLTIYKDCFGATPAPGIENVFFIPDAGCSNIAFSAPFDLISVTEISDLCASELDNSSCNGGFNPGTEAVVYQQTITLDPNCVWEVSYGSSDWNYFVNMDNALLPTAYLSTSVDTNFGCNNSVEVTSDPVPYACVNDPVSHFLTFNNPDGYSLNVSLVGAEIADGIDAPYEAGFTFGEPIPGLTFDPVTYEIAFTAPATFGNYVVVFEIEMVDAMGNVVGTMVEAMSFTVRVCDNLPTYFDTPPLSAVVGGTQLSDTELEICVGDTICFDVEAVNDNPFRSVTVSSSNLGTLFANVDAVSVPGNPGSLGVCISPTDAEIGVQVMDFEAIDDACVNPVSDNISITLEVLPQLEVNFTDSLICYGEQIALQASGDTDYAWNVISGTSTPAIAGTGGTQTITPDTPLLIEVIGNNAPSLQCNWRDTISVDVSLYDLGAVVVDESCVQNDGSVTLTVIGGVGPFDYAWDVTADNVNAVTGLSGGTDVNVTVTDTAFPGAAGCTRSETYPIATTPPPTASIAGDVTICAGDSHDIPVTLTGTGPFDVTVSGTLYTGLNDGDVITVSPAATTTYTLTLAEDANTPACTYSTPSSVTVTVRDIPAVTLTGNTDLCAGESTDLTFNTVPPGLTLDVQGNDAALNAQLTDGDVLTLTPGVPGITTYTLTEVAYTDAPTCPNTTPSSLAVTVDPLPTGTLGFTGASTICAGDAVVLHFELTGTGPWIIDYTIDGTAQTAINTALDAYDLLISPGPLVDTEYCITQITDSGTGCVNTASSCVTLTVNSLPTGTVSTTGPFCAGDAVDLTLNFTGNGPMDVTLTDPAGTAITVAGPYNDGDVITVPTAATGDYCLNTVTDANGCVATGLPNCSAIVVSPLPSATVMGNAVICAGEDYGYNWSGLVGTAPFEVSWELLATDGITVVDAGTTTGVNNGDILTLTPAESVTFQITGISDATPGLCGAGAQVGTFDITVDPLPTGTLGFTGASTICAGDAVVLHFELTGAGPWIIDYTIDGTAQTAINTALDVYDLLISSGPVVDTEYCITQITDVGTGCVNTTSSCVTLTVNTLPTGTVSTTGPFCAGDAVDLTLNFTGNGPMDVTLTDPAGGAITVAGPYNDGDVITVPNAETGDYCLGTVTDANGCTAAGVPNCSAIVFSPLPSATVMGSAVVCADDNYDFNWSGLVGTAPFDVSWELLATDGITVVDSGTATGVNNGDILTLTPADSVTFQITGISDATPGLCGDGAQAGTFDIAVNPYTTIALPASSVTVCQGEAVPVTVTFGNAVGPALQVDLGTEVVNLTTADLDASGQYTFDATYDTSLPGTGSITIASVTDAGNPCTQIDLASVDVTVVETPVATFAGDFAVCPGTGTDLTLGVPLTGGPYDVVITNDAGDPDITLIGVTGNQSIPISPAATTTYTVTSITETGSGLGCANTMAETVTVTVNTLPTIVQPIDTICGNNGDAFQVSFEIIGGTPATYTVTTTDGYAGTISAGPPYIYTSDNIPDNTAQTWTVTDAAGCNPESITLDAFDCPVLTFAGTVDENPIFACEGGIVCLTQNGDEVLDADDVLSFALLDGPNLATSAILDIQPGNCWDLAMLAFPPFATGGTYYAVALAGNNDGTGVADVTDPNLNVSPSVEVLFVEDPVATITGGQTICNGTSTPLSVAITGTGNFDLTYTDPAGAATELLGLEAADLPVTFDANQAGDYAVTVISSYGCPGAAGSTTTVNFFPAINGTISAGGAICEGEVFTFDIGLQGDANWSIELEFDNGTASGTTIESDLTTSPFVWSVNQPGTYSLLSATDANGCTETYTNGEALVVNTLPTAAWQETAINFCEGGSGDALVDLTGPADYTLNYSIDAVAQPAVVTSDTPYTLTGISATGTYTLDSVTDANGCTATIDQDLVVTEVLLPTADAGADQDVCSDEGVLIGTPAEGGNAYDWTVDTGDVADWLNNTTAAEPTASITNTDAPNVATYTFTVTVTEPVASCTSTDDVVVTVNPVPTSDAGMDANICYGDPFTLNGSGDGDCAWTDNGAFAAAGDLLLCAPTTSALTATTTFELTITSAAGCTNTDEVTVTVPDELTESVVFDGVVCFGTCTAEATITPVGGWGEYVVTGDVTDVATTDLCAGMYNYTVTDAEGCTVDGAFEVTEQPAYYIDDVIVDAPNCFGEQDGELEIQTVGGVEYFLDGTSSITNTFSDLGAGTYLIEVTDLNGCTADTTVTIDTNSPEITLDVNFTNTVVCFDQALEFIATAGGGVGDFTYNWYQDAPPPGTIYDVGSPLEVVMDEELLLFVVAYDDNGCPSDTLSMEAVFSTPVSVSASPTTAQTICIGQCVDVNAITSGGSGPIEVTWVEDGIFDDDLIGNDPNYTLCPEESINFVVFADDGCAPVASDTVFVTVNPAPDVEFTLDVDFGCLPLEVNFTNETPDASTTCFWDFGDGTILNVCEDVTYVYEEVGTFFPSLNITSDQGCTGTDLSLTPVNVYGFPEADFYWDPVPVTTLENEVSLINTSTDGVSYLWDITGYGTATTEDVEITFAPVDLAQYEVCLQTTNMFGCTDTLCQTISMESELLVYVPNAFTPDNDGLNDLLTPSVLGLLPSTYHFQVFDRWGHIVFESYTVGEGWNGSFQNGTHYVQEDVYLWRIEGQDVGGADVVTLQGHVTVVR